MKLKQNEKRYTLNAKKNRIANKENGRWRASLSIVGMNSFKASEWFATQISRTAWKSALSVDSKSRLGECMAAADKMPSMLARWAQKGANKSCVFFNKPKCFLNFWIIRSPLGEFTSACPKVDPWLQVLTSGIGAGHWVGSQWLWAPTQHGHS